MPAPPPRPCLRRPRRSAAALALLTLPVGALAGCDHGHRLTAVAAADACYPEVAAPAEAPIAGSGYCPPLSDEDGGGRCRDRFYPGGLRCDAHRGCGAGACVDGRCLFDDADGDQVDDALEREVAQRNLPALALHPRESCAGPRTIVYRARRHPQAPSRLAISYVVLYDRDCGVLNPHLGDNEGLAITVDLDQPPGAAATVGIITSAHRNTPCDSTSSCEATPGSGACAPPGAERARVFVSADKHANYLDLATCERNCFDHCAPGPVDAAAPLLGVGQPDLPLSRDLTESGVVHAGLGWDPRLLHFNPWGRRAFGDAGDVRRQLLELIAPPGLPPASGSGIAR